MKRAYWLDFETKHIAFHFISVLVVQIVSYTLIENLPYISQT